VTSSGHERHKEKQSIIDEPQFTPDGDKKMYVYISINYYNFPLLYS